MHLKSPLGNKSQLPSATILSSFSASVQRVDQCKQWTSFRRPCSGPNLVPSSLIRLLDSLWLLPIPSYYSDRHRDHCKVISILLYHASNCFKRHTNERNPPHCTPAHLYTVFRGLWDSMSSWSRHNKEDSTHTHSTGLHLTYICSIMFERRCVPVAYVKDGFCLFFVFFVALNA